MRALFLSSVLRCSLPLQASLNTHRPSRRKYKHAFRGDQQLFRSVSGQYVHFFRGAGWAIETHRISSLLRQAVFWLSEYVMGGIFKLAQENGSLHAILQPEVSRAILARHIGTDLFACLIVSLLGVGSIVLQVFTAVKDA